LNKKPTAQFASICLSGRGSAGSDVAIFLSFFRRRR
jgi:hypothetical protein